jgi:hypothetical protein
VSLRKEVERLRAVVVGGQQGTYERPLYLTLYMKELDNIERQERGEEPIPLTPEEVELKRQQERWFLEEYIPTLRQEEARPEILDIANRLEEHAKERRLKNEE